MASHSSEDIDKALRALYKGGKDLGLI